MMPPAERMEQVRAYVEASPPPPRPGTPLLPPGMTLHDCRVRSIERLEAEALFNLDDEHVRRLHAQFRVPALRRADDFVSHVAAVLLERRALLEVPKKSKRKRQPAFWGDGPVRSALIKMHRQMSVREAIDQLQEEFGRAPSKSAIARFWLQLDDETNSQGMRA